MTISIDLTITDDRLEAGLVNELKRYHEGHPDPENAIQSPTVYVEHWLRGKLEEWAKVHEQTVIARVLADPVKVAELVAGERLKEGEKV